MNFTRKGYGRIYVRKESDIQKVIDIISKIDEYESNFLPKNFITTIDEYPNLEYTHKFCDLDLNKLIYECWQQNIEIWCLDNGFEEYLNI